MCVETYHDSTYAISTPPMTVGAVQRCQHSLIISVAGSCARQYWTATEATTATHNNNNSIHINNNNDNDNDDNDDDDNDNNNNDDDDNNNNRYENNATIVIVALKRTKRYDRRVRFLWLIVVCV